MSNIKEIKTKIKSIRSTFKITKAMEMVAASKMRKAQERMLNGRPYTRKIREIASRLIETHPDYQHEYLKTSSCIENNNIGIIVISTDKGLCGGLNTNLNKLILIKLKELMQENVQVSFSAIGQKSVNFLTRIGANLVSQCVNISDNPSLSSLLGTVKVQTDLYVSNVIHSVYLLTTQFVNTMVQKPIFFRLLPLPDINYLDKFEQDENFLNTSSSGKSLYNWQYIYEPNPYAVIDDLLKRYVESIVLQATLENSASEQAARMVAMKSASDNAKKIIGDLNQVYNKTRQADITKEISEIIGGASAI